MAMSVDIGITYIVRPYSGKVWEYNTRKEAEVRFKEEKSSDPALCLIKRTKIVSIKYDHLN